jgi:transposase-like protein
LKKTAVVELCTRQGSAKVIAQKLGVSRPTLYNWKNQLAGPEVPASMKRQKELTPESQPERAELERQVESLRRDIRRLQLEHDLLRDDDVLLAECCVHPAVAVATMIEFEDMSDRPAHIGILVRSLQSRPMIEIGAAGKTELGQ